MSTIPEGYDLIAEGICTFSDSPKTYLGSWYHCEEEDVYYFLLKKEESDEDDEYGGEIYPVEKENMVCDDVGVYGWFSKTMENYTFVDLSEEEEEEDEEEEGSFWKSLQPKDEDSDSDSDEDDVYIDWVMENRDDIYCNDEPYEFYYEDEDEDDY